jgi:hypothetical protein
VRDAVEVECVDEVIRVPRLAAAAASQEAPQLVVKRAAAPLRAMLQSNERRYRGASQSRLADP